MSETECRRGFCLKGDKHLNGAGWCSHMAMDEHSNAYFVGIDELPDTQPRQRGLAERQPGDRMRWVNCETCGVGWSHADYCPFSAVQP